MNGYVGVGVGGMMAYVCVCMYVCKNVCACMSISSGARELSSSSRIVLFCIMLCVYFVLCLAFVYILFSLFYGISQVFFHYHTWIEFSSLILESWVVLKIEVSVQISGLSQSLRRKEIASVCVGGWRVRVCLRGPRPLCVCHCECVYVLCFNWRVNYTIGCNSLFSCLPI